MSRLSITWLGHSTFVIRLASGQRFATDPWLGSPTCPAEWSRPEALAPLDFILVSHGHDDHAHDVIPLARATGAPVICLHELGQHLAGKGLQDVRDMGIGGTQDIGDARVTMTAAVHSGSGTDGGSLVYLGGAAGYVIRAPDTPTLYFAGDTALFGDMRIIGEIYQPEIAFLPIGDHYTMGPDTAAIAARWLGVRQVVPMHWGTFPLLRGTPAALREALHGSDIEVLMLQPGDTAE
jgi:L-ascorbate metabolism protein UlaG (beta-lactamase superfamily)